MLVRIPISEIIFDLSMFNALKTHYKKNLKRKNERKINTGFTTPLKRVNQFLSNKNRNITEPVKLKKMRNTGFYKILNGRHRVVHSLATGKKNVLANVIN